MRFDMSHLLVTTDWLHAHLGDTNLRIVDIRGHVAPPTDPLPHYYNHQADYERSHIPGAVFVDWVREITDPADPRHAKIAPPERYAAAMARAGIDAHTLVVAYDDAQGMFAARLWWSLNYFGHARVAVLDGGWQKWVAEGKPTDSAVPAIRPTQFVARPQPQWIRTLREVIATVSGENAIQLVDARSPAEFAGQASRAARKGHIPNAINVPRTELVNTDGTLLASQQLREKFATKGIDEKTTVTTYCNGGVSASFVLLALRVAGYTNNANYDGSWKEWGNDDALPIA
jgi:thiosulfate/3-mercaptopyruvate sulfurtransferase